MLVSEMHFISKQKYCCWFPLSFIPYFLLLTSSQISTNLCYVEMVMTGCTSCIFVFVLSFFNIINIFEINIIIFLMCYCSIVICWTLYMCEDFV